MNRREFIKTAAYVSLLGAFGSGKWLYAMEQEGLDVLGQNLQTVWKDTTIYHTFYNHVKQNKGEQLIQRNDLLTSSVLLLRNPKSLLFFGHITDIHIVDEESPTRLVAAEEFLELLGIRGSFRPQEDLLLHSANSMVQTLNKISNKSPFDFVFNTGDSVDNAHEIELTTFLTTLAGGYVDPDSGANEDPVAGPSNDANDPFTAPGLNNVPVYAAIGNHDVLYQGNVPVSLRGIFNSIVEHLSKSLILHDPVLDESNAVIVPSGEPQKPGNLKPGKIVPDARRRGLEGKDFIQCHFDNTRRMLGFPKELAGKEMAYYTVKPKADLPLKMIVLDTTCRLGTAFGVMDSEQFENFLIPELEKAKQEKELVIIASHHPAEGILTLPEIKQQVHTLFGRDAKLEKLSKQLIAHMDQSRQHFVSRNELVETLKSYPNVFLHLVGHHHKNEIIPMGKGLNAYWQVQTSSLIDFPQQSRLFEIVYEGNNIGAIQTCVVDHNSAKNSLAARCRELAFQDKHAVSSFSGGIQDRNNILRFEIPAEIAKKLEK